MANHSEAGKGDRNRSNTEAYRYGYDKIKWNVPKPSGEEPEEVQQSEDLPRPEEHLPA